MGRLPLHRLPGRGRGRAGQPQREAADPLLPRAGRGAPPRAPRPLRARRRDRHRRAEGPRLRRALPAHPPGREAHPPAGRVDAGVVRRLRPAGPRRPLLHGDALRQAPRRAREAAGEGTPAGPPDAGHRGPRRGQRLVLPLRGRRAGRGGRQAGGPALPARQAGHGQGEAPADGRLRRGRVPHAQGRCRRGLTAPRALRRGGDPAPRRRGLRVQRGAPPRAGGRARTVAGRRARGPPVGGLGARRARADGCRGGRTAGTRART